VRVHVAFTPAETVTAPCGIVVDVLRATSTIAQALACGYRRVLSCSDVEEARGLRDSEGGGVLAGERGCVRIPGFALGNSPAEFVEPRGDTAILTTTNGTRALVTAAGSCERVLAGSLLNLGAVVEAAGEAGGDVTIVCAGVLGEFALDDAYCAGRIVQGLDGTRSDAAIAAQLVAEPFPDALSGLNARTYGPPGLEEDIRFCARESVLDVIPRYDGMDGPAAVIRRFG
jgi:2-phosphosulfolactate phosphatase